MLVKKLQKFAQFVNIHKASWKLNQKIINDKNGDRKIIVFSEMWRGEGLVSLLKGGRPLYASPYHITELMTNKVKMENYLFNAFPSLFVVLTFFCNFLATSKRNFTILPE